MTLPTAPTLRGSLPRPPVSDADTWRDLAHTTPAALNGRIQLALTLLQRLPASRDVDAVRQALEGVGLERIVAEHGEVGG